MQQTLMALLKKWPHVFHVAIIYHDGDKPALKFKPEAVSLLSRTSQVKDIILAWLVLQAEKIPTPWYARYIS